jgi:hypothetical protein
MKKVILGIVLTSILALSACVSTKVFSLKDPSYAGHRFRRVLVFGDFAKIEYKQAFEDQTVDDLISDHIAARASYQLLPPLRPYTDSEKVAVYRQNGFDCYIIISPQEADTREYHVPTYTTGNVAVYGNNSSAYGSGSSETTGGYTEQQISGYNFKVELFDFATGKLVCRCEATTSLQYNAYGKTWASMGNVESSACSNLVDELMKNDLFWGTK